MSLLLVSSVQYQTRLFCLCDVGGTDYLAMAVIMTGDTVCR